jgi:hypothetical protein
MPVRTADDVAIVLKLAEIKLAGYPDSRGRNRRSANSPGRRRAKQAWLEAKAPSEHEPGKPGFSEREPSKPGFGA